MKILKYIGVIVATAMATVACKKDLMTYDTSMTNVYFAFGGQMTGAVDSLSLGIVENGAPKDSVIGVRVEIMGMPTGYDRAISFEIPDDGYTNAVEGRDYELLTEESMVPADSIWGEVKVKLLSSEQLTAAGTVGMKLKLRLLPNEHFTTDYSALADPEVARDEERRKYNMNSLNYKIRFNNNTQVSILWIAETYSSQSPGVSAYNSWISFWGKFSPQKVAMIIEASDGGTDEIGMYPPSKEYMASVSSGLPPSNHPAYEYAVPQVYTSSRKSATWAANFNKLLAKYISENDERFEYFTQNGVKYMLDTYNTEIEGENVIMELGTTGKEIY